MRKPRNDKLFITDGTKIGRLTVGDLIRDVRTHPLYESTPDSYLQQGRLREVHCECGTVRLVAESILATGRLQSCGCLRAEMRMEAQKLRVNNLRRKAEKETINLQIKVEQAELKRLMGIPTPYRDEKAIDAQATKLRKLFARKGVLNRKESHKETWLNVMKPRMLDKLLQDPEADNPENHEP